MTKNKANNNIDNEDIIENDNNIIRNDAVYEMITENEDVLVNGKKLNYNIIDNNKELELPDNNIVKDNNVPNKETINNKQSNRKIVGGNE